MLHVLARLTLREPESFALDLVAAGTRLGIEVGVISGGGPLLPALAAQEVPHEALALDAPGTLAFRTNVARLARLIRRQRVELVHAHGTAALCAVPAARRAGVPVLASLYQLPREAQLRRRLLAAASQADAVLAVSDALVPTLASEGAVAYDKIAVIPGGIDLRRFHPAQIAPDKLLRLARRWRLPDHAPVALLPTALLPGESHELVIEALALLHERPLHLVLLGEPGGDPDYVRGLLRLCDERSVGHRVCIVEEWEELPVAAVLAETLVVASPRLDMAGEALAVAQAMGRPAVALEHPGVDALPSVGALTWLSPPDDPAALADALREALDLPEEERLALAPAGMESVRENYDRSFSCNAVLETYGWLLGRGGARQQTDTFDEDDAPPEQ
jgi:glycosyltransferase involved in cell wall biosynthesis